MKFLLSCLSLFLIFTSFVFSGTSQVDSLQTLKKNGAEFSEPTNSTEPLAKPVLTDFEMKQNVYKSITNSIDLFNTAEGSFITNIINNFETTIEYFTDINEQISLQRISDKSTNIEQYYKNNMLMIFNKSDSTINVSTVAKTSDKRLNITKQDCKYNDIRYYSPKDTIGNENCYRTDLTRTGLASLSLFSQELAYGFLKDLSQWNITREINICEREALVIEGKISGDYSEKLNVYQFKLYIDKCTGIILQFEGYNNQDKLSQYIYTKDIRIDDLRTTDKIKNMISTLERQAAKQ